MASHAQAYRETPASARGNLSPFQLRQLVRYSGLPEGAKLFILSGLNISGGAGKLIYASNKSLGIEMRKAERTVQYHRRRMLHELKVCAVIRHRDTWDPCPKCGAVRTQNQCDTCGRVGEAGKEFRRIATLEIDTEKIASFRPRSRERQRESWTSYKQYQASPEYPGKKRPESGHRSTAQASTEKPKEESAAAKPALVAPPHRSTERPLRRLTSREGPKLINEMRRLMKGVTRQNGLREVTPNGGFDLPGDDPRYRPPMSQENALVAACMNLGIPYESAREHLKLCRIADDETFSTVPDSMGPPPSKAELRRDRNLAVNIRVKERFLRRFGRPPDVDESEQPEGP